MPMNGLVLFSQVVPSSRYSRFVPILGQYFLGALEVGSPAASNIMALGDPISLEIFFTAWRTSDLCFMGTTLTNPSYVINI